MKATLQNEALLTVGRGAGRAFELVMANPLLSAVLSCSLIQWLENQQFRSQRGEQQVWVEERGHWEQDAAGVEGPPGPSYSPEGDTTYSVTPPLIPGVTPPVATIVTPSGALDLTVDLPPGTVRSPVIPGTIIPNPVFIMLNDEAAPEKGTSTVIAGGPDVGYLIYENEKPQQVEQLPAGWTSEQISEAMRAISEDPWLNGLFGGPEG